MGQSRRTNREKVHLFQPAGGRCARDRSEGTDRDGGRTRNRKRLVRNERGSTFSIQKGGCPMFGGKKGTTSARMMAKKNKARECPILQNHRQIRPNVTSINRRGCHSCRGLQKSSSDPLKVLRHHDAGRGIYLSSTNSRGGASKVSWVLVTGGAGIFNYLRVREEGSFVCEHNGQQQH